MRYCLWCHHLITLDIYWGNVVLPNTNGNLCNTCVNQLKLLPKEHCYYCNRPSAKKRCHDCEKWQHFYPHQDPLERNVSIFAYDEFLQEIITKWKYRGDYILGEVFKESIIEVYKQEYAHDLSEIVILPIPLSENRLRERAFNQATEIAKFLPGKLGDNLKRINSEKQSKKSRHQRMTTPNPFILQKPINKPVLLVDDIYTTGRTLRHAAELLKDNGCPKVFALTLARG